MRTCKGSRRRRGVAPPADEPSLRRRRERIRRGWALAPGPALGLGTVEGARGLGGALLRGALVRQARNAVLLGVEQHLAAGAGGGALGWLRREVVIRVGEVLEPGELADTGGDGAGEGVVGDVELLEAGHGGEGAREGALEVVEADVEDGEVAEEANLGRDATGQVVVEEDDLVEGGGHPADAGGDAAAQVVVGHYHHGGRRGAQIGGDAVAEAVGVEEDGVEGTVEERRGNGALELVEAEVQVAEGGQGEDDVRELAHEAVVAEVELVEEAEEVEGGRDDAAEAVGVKVEEGEVGEEAELGGQVPGDVGVVEVDAGDNGEGRVGGGGGAENAEVGADIGADPVAGQVLGVGEDGRPLPRLQGNIGLPEPRVGESEPGIDHYGAPGGAISGFGHRREEEGAEGAARQQQQQEEPAG